MLVEMSLDAAVCAAREPAAQRAPEPAPEPAPEAEPGAAALADLRAAGLVDCEAIGDPARLADEAAALDALCAHLPGPIYRLAPFHYAFALPAGGAPEALAAALDAALGAEAVWLGPLEAAPGPAPDPASDLGPAALPPAEVLFLRAREASVAAGLAAAGPDARAVIDAAWAADCARLAAGADPGGPLGRRLAGVEAGLEAILARLDAQAAALAALAAGIERGSEAFEARLGLALAEFLARIERREAEAASVAPAAAAPVPATPFARG